MRLQRRFHIVFGHRDCRNEKQPDGRDRNLRTLEYPSHVRSVYAAHTFIVSMRRRY